MTKNLIRNSFIVLLSVFTVFNTPTVYGITNLSDDDHWETKVDTYILENMQKLDDTIPVWLWMEDIDHDTVAEKVYENTGLRENNLDVINEPVSDQLAMGIATIEDATASVKNKVKAEFQKYLNKTEPSRRIEAQRVDTYLQELRSVQNDMYRQKNALVFAELGLSNDSIIKSELQAPVYIVYVNKNDIRRLANHPKVTAIYYYVDEVMVPEGNTIPEVMSGSTISRIRNELDLTGKGVKLGIIDSGKVMPCDEVAASRITYVEPSSSYYSDHSTFVAKVSAGTNGVAPDASIYSSFAGNLINSITNLSTAGVCVANLSQGYGGRTSAYTELEIYVDYIVSQKKFLIVKSAGNNHGTITSPGLAYNVITVGGFFNQGTAAQEDDVMYEWSNYNNMTGCFKPDFVADQSCTSDGGTGTSYAAPFVTGVIALLYQLRPSLACQPESVKAILMASCHRKVNPSGSDPVESITTGLTEHQGAGAIDPYKAIAIAGSRHYGTRILDSSVSDERIRFIQPTYGASGLNVSLTWSVVPPDLGTPAPETDLNLRLLNSGVTMKASRQTTSSSEMVYVTPSSVSTDYSINIQRNSETETPVRYAYAFSLSKERYQFTGITEGVYCLKNKATGLYLALKEGNVTQTRFTNTSPLRWVLTDGNVSAVTTANNRLAIGSALDGNYKKAITNSSSGANIIFQVNRIEKEYDDTITICDLSTQRALTVYENSTTVGASAAWIPLSMSNDYCDWYLEPVAYQRGDVNFNGTFESEDAQLVLKYSVGQVTLSDLQVYLGDVNGDGAVNTADALMIDQIISGVI